MIVETQPDLSNIERLRKKINSEDYLHEAIQRIALVMTNELLDISQGGMYHERQWKGRRKSRQ
jgi:hypothetical protein